MHKVYYQYDPAKHLYRRVYPSYRQRIKTYIRNAVYCIFTAGLFVAIYILCSNRPSIRDLKKENKELMLQYTLLSDKIDNGYNVLADLQQRDDNIYRVLLGAKPSEHSEAASEKADSAFSYIDFLTQTNTELVEVLKKRSELLEAKLFSQSKSYGELSELVKQNEKRLAAIPAIMPVYNKDLKRTASGYGYRIDPIYHTQKFHAGLDFAVVRNTPIYATGNGTVIYADKRGSFGNLVEVDHGYGYVTRYAHLESFKVKKGDKVVRGQVIALSGSTGKSTGPHLHYEVLVKGKYDDPSNYFFQDLNAEQYVELRNLASTYSKVFD